MKIGGKIISLENVDSTNSLLLSDRYRLMPAGTVMTAETQTAGRGRGNKIWFSPKGGLYFSILLDTQADLNEYNKLALMIAFAIREELLEHCNTADFRIKWPNDILADGRKICGILTQAKTRGKISRIAVGIGINLNIDAADFPQDMDIDPVSLSELAGKTIDKEIFLRELLTRIDKVHNDFLDGGWDKIIDDINAVLFSKGREMDFAIKGKMKNFRVLGINPDATLRVYSPETGIITISIIDTK
ncbi:MAG TPA: biotin--[acetyl-CoA-carboxylase] ligase [candidate division Zixibacteria bacterium]|nr:biotin--[acetyl-CoA-carboxylase] ligase [candidate division Zixibacteria bacterium]